MAVIDQIKTNDLISAGGISQDIIAEVKRRIALAFWLWYAAHGEDEVLHRKVWMISVTIRIKHLRPIFEDLFGPPR